MFARWYRHVVFYARIYPVAWPVERMNSSRPVPSRVSSSSEVQHFGVMPYWLLA